MTGAKGSRKGKIILFVYVRERYGLLYDYGKDQHAHDNVASFKIYSILWFFNK